MNTFVWIVQGLLAAVFLAHGLLFLFPPEAVRKIKKQNPLPEGFMLFIYVAEIAGPIRAHPAGVDRDTTLADPAGGGWPDAHHGWRDRLPRVAA